MATEPLHVATPVKSARCLASSPVPRLVLNSRRSMFQRYLRFCMVGGSGVVVDMVILWLLASSHTLAWNLTLSKIIAAEVALLNNFAWNEVWTFRGLVATDSWRQLLLRCLKFNAICVSGIALSVLLLRLQVYGLGWNLLISNFLAIVLVSVWNFLLNLRFGWTPTRNLHEGRDPEVLRTDGESRR